MPKLNCEKAKPVEHLFVKKKVFNWSELHLSEVASYKIHTLRFSKRINYRKIVSSNTSHLEAHAGFFRLYMKGILDPYVL